MECPDEWVEFLYKVISQSLVRHSKVLPPLRSVHNIYFKHLPLLWACTGNAGLGAVNNYLQSAMNSSDSSQFLFRYDSSHYNQYWDGGILCERMFFTNKLSIAQAMQFTWSR